MEIITNGMRHKLSAKTLLVIPLLSNYKVHYKENRISCIYVYNVDTHEEMIIGINHTDLPKNDISIINDICAETLYSYKSRYLDICNVIDIELLYWYYYNEKFNDDYLTSEILSIYYRWFSNINNINDCIPIVKLYEYFRSIRIAYQYSIKHLEITDGVKYYHDVILSNLIQIEKNGMYTINNTFEYGYYTITSITGRPANNFNRINYLALSRTDDSRSKYISRYNDGMLVEIDFNSFHPHLIAKMIGYDFKDLNPYVYLAQKYFGNILVDSTAYSLSKEITFRAIYGQSIGEYEDIEFIKRIKLFTKHLWKEFNTNGYILTPIAKRKLQKTFYNSITETTLFNYYLQATETEIMGRILELLNSQLDNMHKIILYVYDSILIDFNTLSPDFSINDYIYNIMNKVNLSYTIKVGKNYKELYEVTADTK